MNIYELIEAVSLERNRLTDPLRGQILNAYPWAKWDQAGNVFLSGLDSNHRVPHQVIFTIMGIIDVNSKHIPLSHKQKWFFVNNIIDYWPEMSCRARAHLML